MLPFVNELYQVFTVTIATTRVPYHLKWPEGEAEQDDAKKLVGGFATTLEIGTVYCRKPCGLWRRGLCNLLYSHIFEQRKVWWMLLCHPLAYQSHMKWEMSDPICLYCIAVHVSVKPIRDDLKDEACLWINWWCLLDPLCTVQPNLVYNNAMDNLIAFTSRLQHDILLLQECQAIPSWTNLVYAFLLLSNTLLR